MILEVAQVPVRPGSEDAFVQALARAADEILPQAEGCLEFTAYGWCIERPGVYLFTIAWQSLEDHTERFRGTELFVRWRELIGPYFDGDPVVEHFTG